MKLPEYITADEVKRVCNEIGLRDWFKITDPTVSEEEASTILNLSLIHISEPTRPY